MDLIGGYDSDAENGSRSASEENPRHEAAAVHIDSDESSDDESVDSATQRAMAAAARLKDYGEEDDAPTSTALPSATSAFGQVEGPPAFLDPEATRPLARAAAHAAPQSSGMANASAAEPGDKQPFDIAKLAPKLKGDITEKRAAPGVIEGKAKRYKLDDDGIEATQQYSAAQIAMFGGNVDNMKGPQPQQQQQQQQAPGASAPSKPMPVDDFLARGLGGAQLPRARQDRKDKEKSKRALGQSTHSHWKSEAEMVLRQQFD